LYSLSQKKKESQNLNLIFLSLQNLYFVSLFPEINSVNLIIFTLKFSQSVRFLPIELSKQKFPSIINTQTRYISQTKLTKNPFSLKFPICFI